MASANTNTDQTQLGPKVAAHRHALYELFQAMWIKLAHVREGTGGFLDGTYLQAHPREWLDHTTKVTDPLTKAVSYKTNPNPRVPSPKLKARRALARYENVAGAILEAKKSALFREQPTRRLDGRSSQDAESKTPLEQWWENVDGKGTHVDDAMPIWWDLAATFGHVLLYMDLQPTTGQVLTAADQPAPYVRLYTPLDVLDWLTDDNGNVTSIKVVEAVPPTSYSDSRSVTTYRLRIIDEQEWAVYDYKSGKPIDRAPHGFGRLPVVWLYGRRRGLLTDIGDSVLGDPRNYIDLFNLTSEIRELLRSQTFSFLNMPLGSGPDAMSVEQAQTMMGQQTGTMNVLFSAEPAQILTGDPANVTSYHEEVARVKREIYRETGVQWESDSKDAEAQGSLELKREDMNTRLAMYADECQQAEYGLIDCFYRARYGAEQGVGTKDRDQPVVHYPERFAITPFDEVLAEIQAAQAIGMPAEFLKALRKAIITKFEGMANLSPEELEEIREAIDKAIDDPTPAERNRQRMDILKAAMETGAKAPKAAMDEEAAA